MGIKDPTKQITSFQENLKLALKRADAMICNFHGAPLI